MPARRHWLASVVFILLIMVKLRPACEVANAQEVVPSRGQPVPVVSDEVLADVRNRLFPLDLLKEGSAKSVIVLRFTPSFEADKQITIIERQTGAEVTELKSLDGNVYYKLNDILARTGREDAREMAKQIRIGKRQVNISSALITKWRDNLTSNLCTTIRPTNLSNADSVLLDGTFYTLWYSSGGANISCTFYGSENDSHLHPKNPPLVRWMNAIRLEVKER